VSRNRGRKQKQSTGWTRLTPRRLVPGLDYGPIVVGVMNDAPELLDWLLAEGFKRPTLEERSAAVLDQIEARIKGTTTEVAA
jgi:hypothetical protein